MKKIKKLSALLLALVMLFALAMPAMAANDSITVNNATKNETYKLYKLFDLNVNNENNPTAYSYTVNDAWKIFFADEEIQKLVTIDENDYVTAIGDNTPNNAQVVALATAAAKYAKDNGIAPVATKTCAADGNSVAFTDLADGYYLITSTLGTKAMIETTPDSAAVSVNEKNPEDKIEKKVKEDDTGIYGPSNSAQIGDTVEFKSTATLYPNTRNVKVHDKMDSGLTFTSGSVTIEGLNVGTDYTVNEIPDDGDTFDIIFTEEYVNGLTAETILTITYTATLNKDAVKTDENGVAIVDQNNETKITFGDKQSVTSQTKTTTHKSTVHKYADGVEYLAGAEFSLKKGNDIVPLIKLDDNNYRVANGTEVGAVNTFETVSDGDIVIWGLDTDGDYTLEEISAPDGYNKLTAEVKLEVKADNTAKADIENKSGTELPSTGGMGTTLFYVVGGLMILAAVVLLVTKKRMSAE